ncbi:cysteine-rich receptor-like protein kinase 44 [Miscanthus floridulus]|uniref:cysteine-rich receptor-like protein kinase 44 n=1 Tax=Miscanthus floridulus TaxID=154761 RepID=UPI0034599F7E
MKGVLRRGKAIAVKKIFDTHLLGNDNQVKNEILCLTEVRHQNVVQLVGYCVETKLEVVEHSGKHVMAEKHACLLCFEFLCNGSLYKHLSDDTSGLDWDERDKIIWGVCRGLHYLHDKRRIAHRDLKAQNILMDDTMMPKIADFDLSRLLSQEKSRTVTAKLQGTP